MRRGRRVAVWGQEGAQRREKLLGGLFGEPVAAAGNGKGLYVICRELHRLCDHLPATFCSADRQNGHGEPTRLALLVLRRRRAERAVELEGAVQRVRVGEAVDVVPDGMLG